MSETELRDDVERDTETVGSDSVDPVRLTDDIVVTDAFVDFSLGYSNPQELVVVGNDSISMSFGEPFEDAFERDIWLAENEYGVLTGVQRQLPISQGRDEHWTGTKREHISGRTQKRFNSLTHVIVSEHNRRFTDTVLSVAFHTPDGQRTSIPLRVDTAYEIVDRYLNGPLGSESVSYWFVENDVSRTYANIDTDSDTNSNSVSVADSAVGTKYEGYVDATIVLQRSERQDCAWIPARCCDVDGSETVFDDVPFSTKMQTQSQSQSQ